jgi:CheY-like chemotaxis protein
MAHRVLLVDSDPRSLAESTRSFSAGEYLVTSAAKYDDARQRLQFAPPDLLVVDVRLGPHNGLQLVLVAHREHSQMPALVTHDYYDPVLEAEAKKARAVYLVKPITAELLLETARNLLADCPLGPGTEIQRRWPRKRASVGGVLGNTRVRVVDLSYGGVRLEVPDVPDPGWTRGDELTVAPVGRVPIRIVWSRQVSVADRNKWFCGAEILMGSRRRKTDSWRYFVDSVA